MNAGYLPVLQLPSSILHDTFSPCICTTVGSSLNAASNHAVNMRQHGHDQPAMAKPSNHSNSPAYFLTTRTSLSASCHCTNSSSEPHTNTNSYQQYFKSIESVASTQGFTQILPSEAHTLQKRDSIVSQLDSPKSPKNTSLLFPPTPLATPEKTTASKDGFGDGLQVQGREILRSVTPELVPDRMADRLPVTPMQEKGLEGLVPAELPLSAMGARVAV